MDCVVLRIVNFFSILAQNH